MTAPGRAPAAAGEQIGPYRLLRRLGQGSLATVYLAVDDASGQPVALKLLSLAGAGDAPHEARQRFLAEAELARRLRHPDIITILAAGESGGRGWLAMELMAGGDLGRYTLPARLLPEALVLGIGARLARALAHAHRQGVVHRDLKPSNVLVDWPSSSVKLADFGLARLADAQGTRTGLMLGSPVYMAPEQLAGAAPTPASDFYALGVTLFQLLAGRLPFEGGSMGELLRAAASAAPPDLQTLRPELPATVAAAVAALLSKQPAARPQAGDALADALQALLPPP